MWCRAQDETFDAPPPDDVGPEGVMGGIPTDVFREDELLPVPPEDPLEDLALQVGPRLSRSRTMQDYGACKYPLRWNRFYA